MSRPLLQLAAAALVFLLAACGPRDPLERVVAADSAVAFSTWRAQLAGSMNQGQLAEVDAAVGEVKLGIMNNREASGTAAVEEAMRAKVHGRPLREVLRAAYEAKIKRLEVDLKGLAIATEQNSRLTTRAGDTASSQYLDRFKQKQGERVAAAEGELREAQAKLAALGPAPGGAKR